MPANRRHRPRARALVLLVALVHAGAAGAQTLYGTFQTQYQRLDDHQTLVSGSGELRTRTIRQEFWLRTLDVHQQYFPAPDLLVESNARFSDQSFLGQGNYSSTPFGSLRLIHPFLQVFASHQPATQTSSLSSQSGLNPDSITSRQVTSHNRESFITGHFALPKWPQVDASWIHRRRDGAGSIADQNSTRNFRLTLDRDRWSAYGGVNDQVLSSAVPGVSRSTQQVWTAGGAYHYLPQPTLAFHAQYDLSDVRGVAGGERRPSTVNNSGSVSGEWHPGARWLGTASWQVRHVDFGTSVTPAQTDHEGALIARYAITKRSSVLGGGGLRTVRNALPGGATSAALQKYLTSLASVDARVRRNWTMTGGLSHTTNFDPGRAPYHLETASGTSRGLLTRRIQVDGTIQLTANSDSGAVASRYAAAWTARVQGTPLRALLLALSLRNQRTGPGLMRPNAVSRGYVVDGTWKPWPALQLVGQYGSSVAIPASAGRNGSRTLTGRFQPTPRWQWYGSWTRSDQTAFVSSAGQLSSREVVTARVQYERSRQMAMTAGVSYNDPRRATESKRLDLTLTWSFGR